MKKVVLMSVLIGASSLISNNAMAKNFYKASIGLKLTYSNAFEKTKTLESNRAHVVMSDDSGSYNEASFCQLKVEKTIYKCKGYLNGPKNYSVVLESDTLRKILESNFGLSTATVLSLQMQAQPTISRTYSSYSGTERKTKMQFHTEKAEESYHLIATARKAYKQ